MPLSEASSHMQFAYSIAFAIQEFCDVENFVGLRRASGDARERCVIKYLGSARYKFETKKFILKNIPIIGNFA